MASPDKLDLTGGPQWPLSALYHEESKLGPHRLLQFREQIGRFIGDEAAVGQSLQEPLKPYPTRPAIALPRATKENKSIGIGHALHARRSFRGEFSSKPIPLAALGAWLDIAASVTAELSDPSNPNMAPIRLRPWASGGGLYPIETYIVTLSEGDLPSGVFHYQPYRHELRRLNDALRDSWRDRAFWHLDMSKGAVLLILTATFARTQIKYGERGYRIALLDAGHLGQSLLLGATSLGIAATPLGGYDEDAIARDLELDPALESPVHVVLAGLAM